MSQGQGQRAQWSMSRKGSKQRQVGSEQCHRASFNFWHSACVYLQLCNIIIEKRPRGSSLLVGYVAQKVKMGKKSSQHRLLRFIRGHERLSRIQ